MDLTLLSLGIEVLEFEFSFSLFLSSPLLQLLFLLRMKIQINEL